MSHIDDMTTLAKTHLNYETWSDATVRFMLINLGNHVRQFPVSSSLTKTH